MQPRDFRHDPNAAMPSPGRFASRQPTTLLLVKPAHYQNQTAVIVPFTVITASAYSSALGGSWSAV